MADTHIATQTQHVTGPEHIPDQAIVLAQKQPAVVTGNHAGRILATMLENGKTVK
jgi:hypothetical protein